MWAAICAARFGSASLETGYQRNLSPLVARFASGNEHLFDLG